jgi:RimJ/RimL family protein N-acetyltransferase
VNEVAAVGAYPKTVVLTDGTHLVLRLGVPGDAAAVAGLASHGPPDLTLGPADLPDPQRTLTVVACDTARVVAAATLVRRPAREARVASLGVRIDPAYQGRRLGTWMLLDGVHLAAALDIELLAAPSYPEAGPYLAALRRLDFVDDASLRAQHRVPDGRTQGLVVLVKAVHRQWTDF